MANELENTVYVCKEGVASLSSCVKCGRPIVIKMSHKEGNMMFDNHIPAQMALYDHHPKVVAAFIMDVCYTCQPSKKKGM